MHGREVTDTWSVMQGRDNNTMKKLWEGANNGGGVG